MTPCSRQWLGVAAFCFLSTSALGGSVVVERAELGIGNRYKVGSWTPLQLSILSEAENIVAMAVVSVPDNDGVYTSISSAPFSLSAGRTQVIELLVRIGQLESPLQVTIVDIERRKEVFKRKYSPRQLQENKNIARGDPATTRMIVEVGPTSLGANSPEADKSNEAWFTQNLVARVNDLSKLPRQSYAYEAVDTVLLSTSVRNDWKNIPADDPRITALTDWVKFGGRIVLFCGENSDLLLAPDGPLVDFAPGTFTELVTIDSLGPLESYTGGNEPLPKRARIKRAIPTFQSVRGDVELALGDRENRLPTVVRSRLGLGQVVFVGLDIDTPPLREWPSRGLLVEKLLALPTDKLDDDSGNYYYSGPADISLALQEELDRLLENSGIRTPPFLAIAGLVLLYILLIGPGDYLFVKHVLKKMEMTWITFPLIVIATCSAAYWYAAYMKGDSLRVNQLEIVDIDNQSGASRGTMWTHVFSPSPDRYSLTPTTKSPSGNLDDPTKTKVAWLGRPAEGMGGMAEEAGMLAGGSVYRWSVDQDVLSGVPIEIWSTRTFVSRWESNTNDLLSSDLTRTPNKLLTGTVTNPTSLELEDCRLVYGNWAWRLGTFKPSATLEIRSTGIGNTSNAPKRLRNAFKQDFAFNIDSDNYYEHQHLISQLGLRGLAEMMMFYDALGGRKYTHQWNRYQHYVDLSHSLDSNTAMLIGSCRQSRSELVRIRSEEQIESLKGERDTYLVMYRYILPVNHDSQSD